ncbi:MAG: transposase family protein [Rhodobacteraceae bacterium]|nr:transposase family protein [Paracoccaceae bacterium]
MVLPERKLKDIDQFLQQFPDVEEVIIDGVERPIQRPIDSETKRLNYSGKKKRHTRKHLAVIARTKRVLVLTQAREGKVHDKRLLDETELAHRLAS